MIVIAVDTGNRYIKTAHADPFSAGLNRHFDTPPIIVTDTLFYEGNFYSFSETQGFHRKDKTTDDYYFILTLAAIAREIIMKHAVRRANNYGSSLSFLKELKDAERRQTNYKEDIILSVGLPPRDIKALAKKFKDYFLHDGERLQFTYNGLSFDIKICDVFVSPQGFAAVFPNNLFAQVVKAPQAYIIDIGGYTTDIALISNHRIDTNFFESLDFGVIHMYNEIVGIVAKNCQKNITGVLIEAVLRGENIGDKETEDVVRKSADAYAKKLIYSLRDRGIDLELSLPVLVGGGAQLLRKSLEEAIHRDEIFVIPDIKANAIGYEVLANRILKESKK